MIIISTIIIIIYLRMIYWFNGRIMLFWSNFLMIYILMGLMIFNLFFDNIMSTLFTVEFITVLIFFIYIFGGVVFNLNWLFGFSFVVIILAGLEVALAFLLLNV